MIRVCNKQNIFEVQREKKEEAKNKANKETAWTQRTKY